MTTAFATVLSLVAAFWISSSTAFATEAGHTFSGRWTLASVDPPLTDVMARAVDGQPSFRPGTTIDIVRAVDALTARRTTEGTAYRVLRIRHDVFTQDIPGGGTLTGRDRRDGRGVFFEGRLTAKRGLLTRTVPFEERWTIDEGGHRLEIALRLRTPRGVMHRTFTFQRPVFFDQT